MSEVVRVRERGILYNGIINYTSSINYLCKQLCLVIFISENQIYYKYIYLCDVGMYIRNVCDFYIGSDTYMFRGKIN